MGRKSGKTLPELFNIVVKKEQKEMVALLPVLMLQGIIIEAFDHVLIWYWNREGRLKREEAPIRTHPADFFVGNIVFERFKF